MPPVPDTRMPPATLARRAFTLIELLVVIAIIAVLAGLLMPVFHKARLNSYRTVTTSNLKQVAAAILSYAGEHDGELPGPLTLGQGPDYAQTPADSLGFFLWKYLDAPEPTSAVQQAKLLSNPAYERARLKPDAPAYAMHLTVVEGDGLEHQPWGTMRTVAVSGMRQKQSDGTLEASPQIWAMVDLDQKNVARVTDATPSWLASLPKTPAHGEVRMTLFFDWHVEPVKVTDP